MSPALYAVPGGRRRSAPRPERRVYLSVVRHRMPAPVPSPWPTRIRVAAYLLIVAVLMGLGGRLDVTDPETTRPRPVAVRR